MHANHRKHNDGSHNSSTYHKKDGTNVRAILKREAAQEIEDATMTRSQKRAEALEWFKAQDQNRVEALDWVPADAAERQQHRRQLLDLQQLIQDDLQTYFDGMSNRVLTEMCEIVVQRFKHLLDKQPKAE